MKIVAAILAAAISIIVIATMLPTEIQPQTELGWQYDDFKAKANDITGVDGSLETVTVAGVDYIHAKDVGDGTITHADGHVEAVTVKKAVLDVYFALGQSNNAYHDVNVDLASPIPPLGVSYYWGRDNMPNRTVSTADGAFQSMIDYSTGALKIGDKAPSFCAEYYAKTGHKVYYVNASIGGSSINEWIPGGTYFTGANGLLSVAMDAVDTDHFEIQICAYTWIQGEQDSSMSVTEYRAKFLQMHQAIMAGDLGEPFKCGIISQVVSTRAPGPAEAQAELCKEISTLIMGTTIANTFTKANGLMGEDGLHYAQPGDNLIGKDLADAAADRFYPQIKEMGIVNTFVKIIPLILIAGVLIMVARAAMSRD